jgi:F-type H+-transporting ATPase subunit b
MASETHEGQAAPGHAPAGGLPQFDFQWWGGQIVWLAIVFVVLLVFMRRVAVPRLGGTIEAREAKIADDVAQARQLKDEADAQSEAAAADRAQARAAAQKLAGDARAQARAEIDAALAKDDARLAEIAAKAEADIGRARARAMGEVAGVAEEAAQAIVAKLTGVAMNADEMKAARAVGG